MKLKILAEAAAEFYQLPDLRVKQKIDKSHTKKARHNCQWIARDAGYSHSIIAWFWGMDRTSVYYACRIAEDRMASYPAERLEMKELMEFVRNRLTKTRQLSAARKASS
jgi:hypothetical protein